jgi:hypothetical protein
MADDVSSVQQIQSNLKIISAPVESTQPKRWRIRDLLFWGVVGFLGLSTLGSLARIANPEWAAQINAQQAEASHKRAVAIDPMYMTRIPNPSIQKPLLIGVMIG